MCKYWLPHTPNFIFHVHIFFLPNHDFNAAMPNLTLIHNLIRPAAHTTSCLKSWKIRSNQSFSGLLPFLLALWKSTVWTSLTLEVPADSFPPCLFHYWGRDSVTIREFLFTANTTAELTHYIKEQTGGLPVPLQAPQWYKGSEKSRVQKEQQIPATLENICSFWECP